MGDSTSLRTAIRVLLVEDSEVDAFLIVRSLQRGRFHVEFERVDTAAAMYEALTQRDWDLVISDYVMPHFTGPAALELFQRCGLDIPFILLSGMAGEERAVAMLKAGAHFYLMKDRLEQLPSAVHQELKAAVERRIRAQTEAASAYLASLVASCEDAIIGTDVEGKVVSWNAAAERLYGYSPAEMTGRSMAFLLPAYRPEQLTGLLQKLKNSEPSGSLETIHFRKDGKPMQVMLTISPVLDGKGGVIGLSSISRDITGRKCEEAERLTLIQDLTDALAKANASGAAAT